MSHKDLQAFAELATQDGHSGIAVARYLQDIHGLTREEANQIALAAVKKCPLNRLDSSKTMYDLEAFAASVL